MNVFFLSQFLEGVWNISGRRCKCGNVCKVTGETSAFTALQSVNAELIRDRDHLHTGKNEKQCEERLTPLHSPYMSTCLQTSHCEEGREAGLGCI